MIKVDTQTPEGTQSAPASDPAQKADSPPASAGTGKAEPAKPPRPESLAEEAESFCQDLERFFRRAFGEIPKATELGEIRAQQATVRDLVRRAASSGAENSEKVTELTVERDKLKDATARARADFLNYQSRAQKDLERAEELALRSYVMEMLPILDSFDLAAVDIKSGKADAEKLTEAFELVHRSLSQTLQVRGLSRIEALGKPFDPKLHEAVAKRPMDEAKGEKPNIVVEELRAGYLWKGLVLRPAQVLVSEGAPASAPQSSPKS